MTQKTKLILWTLLIFFLCSTVFAIWGIYKLWNDPKIRAGFEGMKNELGAMLELQQKIIATYPCQNAEVNLMNGNTLNISLINSTYGNLSNSEQQETAKDIANFVKKNYTGNAAIIKIIITFTQHNQIGPLNTNFSSSFVFDSSELDE